MARVKKASYNQAIEHNLEVWSPEVGTRFESLARGAAREFDQHTKSKIVVDLGCGDGAAISEFVKLGYTVTGVDINAKKLRHVNDATLIYLDYLTYLKAQSANTVHNIFMHHALEHTPRYKDVLKEISRVLMPRGICLVVVPALDKPHSVHYVAFENPKEILPLNLRPIINEQRERETHEYWCIATKA